jgi:hypothetical protein
LGKKSTRGCDFYPAGGDSPTRLPMVFGEYPNTRKCIWFDRNNAGQMFGQCQASGHIGDVGKPSLYSAATFEAGGDPVFAVEKYAELWRPLEVNGAGRFEIRASPVCLNDNGAMTVAVPMSEPVDPNYTAVAYVARDNQICDLKRTLGADPKCVGTAACP